MNPMEKIEVKNTVGKIILEAHVLQGNLDGSCVWFNADGEKIAVGTFKNGKPFQGTFLDWSLFFTEENITYVPEIYCKDWLSIYESTFLSRKVDYSTVIVQYQNGEKIGKK